mgnify:CR=1 FL=1
MLLLSRIVKKAATDNVEIITVGRKSYKFYELAQESSDISHIPVSKCVKFLVILPLASDINQPLPWFKFDIDQYTR